MPQNGENMDVDVALNNIYINHSTAIGRLICIKRSNLVRSKSDSLRNETIKETNF